MCILFVGLYFNPRLREGGDRNGCRVLFDNCDFNPRLREGGDSLVTYEAQMKDISIHASAKEATPFPIFLLISSALFQSTPPRRRRLQKIRKTRRYKVISIHASAKEATSTKERKTSSIKFQSTPPRRRRHSPPFPTAYHMRFQSTPPRRRRLFPDHTYTIYVDNFNPRLREGGDSFSQI